MTSKARVVLQDAKRAISKHSDDLQSEEFRVSWLSIVSLLRAVGHVLAKVDANSSPYMKQAIEEKWADLQRGKPEPKIFWGFIEYERNRFLKNYEHGISRTMAIPGPDHNGKATIIKIDCANSRGGYMSSPDAAFDSHISDGPFAGAHERDVARKAYDWWSQYLDDIDTQAKRYEPYKSLKYVPALSGLHRTRLRAPLS